LLPLPARQQDRAGTVLGRAFEFDPLWTGIFPDPDRRPALLVAMFTAVTAATIAAEGVAETTPGADAVALWLPPGRDLRLRSLLSSRFALPRFVMRLDAPERRRMMAVLRRLGRRKKDLMPDPHWYLSAVGVIPERQHRGLGSSLVRSGISRADRDGVAVYLETETEANVRFYEHLGFEIREQITAAGLGIPVWSLVREPAAQE
jgi:GNAT superfamily N-acetyltransferase